MYEDETSGESNISRDLLESIVDGFNIMKNSGTKIVLYTNAKVDLHSSEKLFDGVLKVKKVSHDTFIKAKDKHNKDILPFDGDYIPENNQGVLPFNVGGVPKEEKKKKSLHNVKTYKTFNGMRFKLHSTGLTKYDLKVLKRELLRNEEASYTRSSKTKFGYNLYIS